MERIHRSEYRHLFDMRYVFATRISDLGDCLMRHEPDIVHGGSASHGGK